MTLGAGKPSIQMFEVNSIDLTAAVGRWQYSSPSVISHHGKACCTTAREWLFATDLSRLNGQHTLTGPRWIRQRYNWGPLQWPITWCKVVEQKVLDCGALAAMSKDVFHARGVAGYSVQLVQEYTDNITYHWSNQWSEHPASTHWIHGALIYHEACAVETGVDEIRMWDPSAACWVHPKQNGGYGSVRALRIKGDGQISSRLLRWGTHRVRCDEWYIMPTKQKPAPNIHLV